MEISYLTVLLGGEAHSFARQFAAEQTTPEKGKKTYLNTLAVYAVHTALKWLQIETSLVESDSWNPALSTVFDIADLVIPGLGKLECLPILVGETVCRLPPEVPENRIGYVIVQINESLQEAAMLGFVTALMDEVSINQLESFEDFLTYLYELKQSVNTLKSTKFVPTTVNLCQWLQNSFEPQWQSLSSILGKNEQSLVIKLRTSSQLSEASVSRAKLINLGFDMGVQSVMLLIALIETEQEVGILVQVHPSNGENYLVPNLKVGLLSEAGIALQGVQSRGRDNYIQLKRFWVLLGERFSIQIALGDEIVTETFAL